VRERDGLRRIDFFRLRWVSDEWQSDGWSTHSAADTGRGTSSMDVGKCGGVGRSQGESISSSVLGVISGDGDGSATQRSLRKLKGALWGRGEMSIESGTKHGDESGIGGVVTPSHRTGGVVAPAAVANVSICTRCANCTATYPVCRFAERGSR
jgi:hypothetical protein